MAYGDGDRTYAREVGGRLAGLRDQQQLSPEALCGPLALSARTLRDYENGVAVPGGFAIKELVNALGCTSDWLLGILPVRQR